MRNTLTQILPPAAEITLVVDPPMTEGERYYLMAAPGSPKVVGRVVDDAHVTLTNMDSHRFALFVFTVGPILNLPAGISEAITAYLANRKNTPS